MSAPKHPDMRFMSDAIGQNADIGASSDNHAQADEIASTELSLLLLDHGLTASQAKDAVSQIRELAAEWRAGVFGDRVFDMLAETVISSALSKASRRKAA